VVPEVKKKPIVKKKKKELPPLINCEKTNREILKNDFGYLFFIQELHVNAIYNIFGIYNLMFLARIILVCLTLLVFQSAPKCQIILLFSVEATYLILNIIA